MKALGWLWQIVVILFRGLKFLWGKVQSYRALKSQSHKSKAQTIAASEGLLVQEGESSLVESEATDEVWYAPGQAVKVQQIAIADGLIYLGTGETFVGCIDPTLPVESLPQDLPADLLTAKEWDELAPLGYGQLLPLMRVCYLDWLATGRTRREMPAGALLLFLMGLEQRVVTMLTGDRTVDELLALILELERLEIHYAHYPTVQPKIQALAECCQVQLALTCQPETLLALLPVNQTLSTALKVALGRCLEFGKTIPMTLLWAWYQNSSVAVDLKTPAKRCDRAFEFLLQTRGEQQNLTFDLGESPDRLSVVYQPFGVSFGPQPDPIALVETVDITGLETQLTALEPLIEACTQDLDAYSRLIGRSPEAEGTPGAVALLPSELVLMLGNDQVQHLQRWLHDQLTDQRFGICKGQALLDHWPTQTPDKIRKKEAELLGQFLAKLGFGYVPDVRYGQGAFKPDQRVILFRSGALAFDSSSGNYSVAALLVELRPFLPGADSEEIGAILEAIAPPLNLTLAEKTRLEALSLWRQQVPLTWKQVLKRVKKIEPEAQATLAQWVNPTEESDWQWDEAQYADLQMVLPLPKRSPVALESEEESPSPEIIASAETDGEEPLESPQSAPFVLDVQLIHQRHQESQVASGLLDDIFTESETSPLPLVTVPPNQTVKPSALGLDEFHWHLLKHLGQKSSWARTELEAIALTQGLLLDGALENINEVAFDQCDEPLTEGEDPIEVNDWVFEELSAA